MPIYIIFSVFLLVAAYASFAAAVARYRAGVLKTHRSELLALYVKRANLMPRLMNTARKHSPIPPELHNRFTGARDRFAGSKNDADMREANAELDIIFMEFTARYSGFSQPEYIVASEELDILTEKISFQRKFYEEAALNRSRAAGGWLRPGIIMWNAVASAFSSLTGIFKKTTDKK